MRTCIYVITAVAVAGFSSASAQTTGHPAGTPGTHAPGNRSLTLPPVAEPAPPARLAPMPPMQPNSSMGQDMPTTTNRETMPKATEPLPPNAAEQELLPQSTTPPMPPHSGNQQAMPNSTTQPMPPNSANQQAMPNSNRPLPPAPPNPTNPTSTAQQTVFPPDSQIDPNNPANSPQQQRTDPNNRANTQPRVPPASRGVGQSGRPDCSQMRGLEKSECERRDTSRDDLPAGVTTTQPASPPQ